MWTLVLYFRFECKRVPVSDVLSGVFNQLFVFLGVVAIDAAATFVAEPSKCEAFAIHL